MGQVATRRTRTAGKVEIPNVDDHVSKLEHMGKETVKKLQDIKGSAVQSNIDIAVPDNRIDKGARSRRPRGTLVGQGLCAPAAMHADTRIDKGARGAAGGPQALESPGGTGVVRAGCHACAPCCDAG